MRLRLLASLLLLLCAPAPRADAERLRVIRQAEPEEARGMFPPGIDVQLELRPGEPPALAWDWGGLRRHIDPRHIGYAHDTRGGVRVLAFDAVRRELLVLRPSGPAVISEARQVPELAGIDVGGLALDVASGRLFVLDSERRRVLVLAGFRRRHPARTEILLPPDLPRIAGLAFVPTTGHLLALAPEKGELLELAPDGRLFDVHELPRRARAARAIAVAPSSDPTDGIGHYSLYAAVESEGGGDTFEISIDPLMLALAPTVRPTLLRTVRTSDYDPPSPDPSGIERIGDTLLISDGEVDEMPLYAGVNLFATDLDGNLLWTGDTTFYSHEPTGVARNSRNGHLFTSDDDGAHAIFEITPGPDGRIGRGNRVRRIVVGSFIVDPEGLAWGKDSLWVVGGISSEVWRFEAGPNGRFEARGDDVITHFDTAHVGLTDPEGIAFDEDGSSLYVVGEPANRVAHFSADGQLLRWLDISEAQAIAPAGLAYGPGPPGDPTARLYLVARGIDNDSDPDENDGRLFIFAVPPLSSDEKERMAAATAARSARIVESR